MSSDLDGFLLEIDDDPSADDDPSSGDDETPEEEQQSRPHCLIYALFENPDYIG